MDRTKIAIVGTGQIGLRHAQSVVDCKTAHLLCLVDPQPLPAANKTAQDLDVPLFASVKVMLGAGYKPAGAIVSTPNSTHVDVSKELLAADVHVLVEKPVSTDTRSGEDLLNTAQIYGKRIMVGHHRRFNPLITATRNALLEGRIGKPIAVSGLWMLCKPASYFEPPAQWRASPDGGGPILINMIHEVDILQYLLGPITRVHAEQTQAQRKHCVEEGAAILLRFASGVVGTFLLCDASPSKHSFESASGENPIIPKTGADCYRIFGTNGCLSVGDMAMNTNPPDQERSWSNSLSESSLTVESRIPFDEQTSHFVEVILGKAEPRCSGQDGLRALKVCKAIKEAVETGGMVEITI